MKDALRIVRFYLFLIGWPLFGLALWGVWRAAAVVVLLAWAILFNALCEAPHYPPRSPLASRRSRPSA